MHWDIKIKNHSQNLLSSTKEYITKGPKYSGRWFKKSSVDELLSNREIFQNHYLSHPELDFDYKENLLLALDRFDRAISNKYNTGKEYIFPVHGEHGTNLYKAD